MPLAQQYSSPDSQGLTMKTVRVALARHGVAAGLWSVLVGLCRFVEALTITWLDEEHVEEDRPRPSLHTQSINITSSR
jgi:hypothetical protein